MAAGLGALRDEHVDAALEVALRVPRAPAERADEHALRVRGLDRVLGRRPERVDEHRDRVAQRRLDLRRTFELDAETGRLHDAFDAFGQRRHVVLGEHLLDEVAVLGRDHALERAEVELLALADELLRHREVDAVRLAVDVLVDPRELDLELVGAERERAEHAVAAGLADRGDDVAAVREGEERELDAEPVTDRGLHDFLRSETSPGRRFEQGKREQRDRTAPVRSGFPGIETDTIPK